MGESESGYYVRNRGRVTGPHTLAELTQMVRRGTLGRAHDVSGDAANWMPAGKVPELFGSAAAVPVGPVQSLPQPAAPQAETAPGASFFYQHEGTSFGPMPLPLLTTLLQNGQIPSTALVWSDGDANSYPATRHPLLISLFPQTGGDSGSSASTKKSSGKRMSGCGLMLLAAALLCLGGGVYMAIKVSTNETKTSDPEPTTEKTTDTP